METFQDFLRRTDSLAVHLGLKLGDLPKVLGISRASFFAYRSGQRPITSKAWMKLEKAERDGRPEPGESPRTKESSPTYGERAKSIADLWDEPLPVEMAPIILEIRNALAHAKALTGPRSSLEAALGRKLATEDLKKSLGEILFEIEHRIQKSNQ